MTAPSTPAAASAPAGRYLALGDSFTIGTGVAPAQSFAARLVDRWTAAGCALRLENVAVNGYTTNDLIDRELPSLTTFHPTFVTIAIGANDIVRGHAIDAYRENVRRILDAAKDSGARVVVLPQPDWSRSPSAASIGTQAALAASIADFNAALAGDGLHPSTEAYDAWAAEMARVLSSPCAK